MSTFAERVLSAGAPTQALAPLHQRVLVRQGSKTLYDMPWRYIPTRDIVLVPGPLRQTMSHRPPPWLSRRSYCGNRPPKRQITVEADSCAD